MAPVSGSTGMLWISCVALLIVKQFCSSGSWSGNTVRILKNCYTSLVRNGGASSRPAGGGGHKKSSSGESEELSTILVNDCRAVNLTYLSCTSACSVRDGIGTLYRWLNETGCQGFNGPLPSAFLDKRCKKNCCKSNTMGLISPNILKCFFGRHVQKISKHVD